MAQKRLNVSISIDAHKIIEKYKFENDLVTKDEAVDQLILEFGEKYGKGKESKDRKNI